MPSKTCEGNLVWMSGKVSSRKYHVIPDMKYVHFKQRTRPIETLKRGEA
jgi:hypothetical protein